MLKINGYEVEGSCTINASVDRTKKPPILTIEGWISTKQRLPDILGSIEGGRFEVKDILINSESIGSEDDNIVYGFTAREYKIK